MIYNTEEQIKKLKGEVPYIEIEDPCSTKNGIRVLSQDKKKAYAALFDAQKAQLDLLSFIPASGAASRMFKALLEKDKTAQQQFDEHLDDFAFSQINIPPKNLIPYLASLPKALIPFHKYDNQYRTAFEEHLIDAQKLQGKVSNTHFTVNEKHIPLFSETLKNISSSLYNQVNFSTQDPLTNTLCLDANGAVFTAQNIPLKRPAGHGALLKNIQDLNADLIFINNIDNVQVEQKKEKSIETKKVLGGCVLEIKNNIHRIIKQIKNNAFDLKKHQLFLQSIDIYSTVPEEIKRLLDRPIRVCGMVKNQGEPGGGPFWVKTKYGKTRQIVEKVHINNTDLQQEEKLAAATHFNPVNMVLCIKDTNHQKYDLSLFADYNTHIIAHKNHQGKPIKILEYPGLWNGSMADWITLFVEIPAQTFTPVKTVFDLLKDGHQS